MGQLRDHLDLSNITFGTMRLFDKKLSNNQVLSLIEKCYEVGINTHHSSFEYNSYELYCQSLRQFNRRNNIKHIVKLSSPHFEEKRFSARILEERIDLQLKALGIDQIDVLQWLVRSKPITDATRLNTIIHQNEEINHSFRELKQKGKIKSVFSFPYSVTFTEEVLKLEEVDGIISYLNLEERDYVQFANSIPFIAIRPLNAGKLIDKQNPERDLKRCITFVSEQSNVMSQVISINHLEQLKGLKDYI